MKKSARPSLFTVDDRGDVRILRFLHHQNLAGTDLGRINELWSFLEDQQRDPAKVLVLEAPTRLLTPENLDAFWARVVGAEHAGAPERSGVASLWMLREETALSRFIQAIREIDSFVICVLRGAIDLPFLGPALACDYRIVADDTVFVSRYLDLGIPPYGGLSWFLSRFVGQGKARQIQMSADPISARQAHRLHLVDEVVPLGDIEQRVLGRASRFAGKSRSVLVALKQSLVAGEKPLDEYLKEEMRVFGRSIHDEDFSMIHAA